MELAVVTTTYPSSTQTFVMDHVEALVRRGHSVDVFAFQEGDSIHYEPGNGARRIRYIPPTEGKLEVLVKLFRWFSGSLLNGLNPIKALGTEWAADNFPEFTRPLNRVPYLERFVFPDTYRLIHCHFAKPTALMAALLPYIGEPRLVSTLHGYDVFQTDQTGWYTDDFINRCDRFLSHSKNLDEVLTERGVSSEKIVRHRYGIDVDEFTPTPEPPDHDNIHLLSVARFVEKKGLRYALESLDHLPDEIKGKLTFKIAGDGPRRSLLEDVIEDHDLESIVELLGFKDRSEIKALFRWADVFVLPSVVAENGDREGTPVSLLEAQASGLPVVSTYHSGIPEIVQDGETGLLVAERDPQALADALEELINQPDLRERMGESGRQYVVEYHDSEKLTDDLVDLYEDMIES